MLLTISERDKKAIIVDAGGGFISHFYTEGNKILNPSTSPSIVSIPYLKLKQIASRCESRK